MAEVKKPMVLDESFLAHSALLSQIMGETNALLRTQNLFLGKMADMPAGVTNLEVLRKIVMNGDAPKFFNIGDQLVVPWTDRATNTTYQAVMDITHFPTIDTKSKTGLPGMALQWHYNIPFDIQFSQYQAFYYAADGLEAGTYHIKSGTTWGTFTKGEFYQFTLTEPVPVGGQLAGFRDVADTSAWTVQSFASKTDATAIETASVSAGSGGTLLGTIASDAKGTINALQSVAYGYNSWLDSAYRQFLNSEKQAWWEPQSDFDRPATQAATKWGFLSGFEDDFLEIVKPVKVQTARNNLIDGGGFDTTYDRFFLPSKEEIFNTPSISGEGVAWDYWKQRLGRTTPTGNHPNVYQEYIKYNLESKTTAALWRLRSAYLSYSYNVWYVHSSGYVYYGDSRSSYRSAPACIIGG